MSLRIIFKKQKKHIRDQKGDSGVLKKTHSKKLKEFIQETGLEKVQISAEASIGQ